MSIPEFGNGEDKLFSTEKKYLSNFKKAVLMVAGSAAQKLMTTLAKEQEILMNIADMLIDVYVGESLLLRVEKLVGLRGEAACAVHIDMVRTWLNDAADRLHKSGKDAINAFTEGDEQRMMLMGLKRFTKVAPYNTKESRRRVAARLIEEKKYCF